MVIECEKKLLELKEGLAAREKSLKAMERELASHNAALDRYEEQFFSEGNNLENWQKQKIKDVDSWVHSAAKVKQVHFEKGLKLNENKKFVNNTESLGHELVDAEYNSNAIYSLNK